jgi:hypothetical protein
MRKVRWTLGHVPSIENFHVNRPCQQYARALLKPHNPALLAVWLTFLVSAALEQEQYQLVSALRLEPPDDSSAEKTLKTLIRAEGRIALHDASAGGIPKWPGVPTTSRSAA